MEGLFQGSVGMTLLQKERVLGARTCEVILPTWQRSDVFFCDVQTEVVILRFSCMYVSFISSVYL